MLRELLDLYRSLTDPQRLSLLLHTLLAGWAGYAALFAVVYSETGLLVGFFLPGDSFLFTIGVVSGFGALDFRQVNLLLMTGRAAGRFHRLPARPPDRPQDLQPPGFAASSSRSTSVRTHAFYERYGGKTVVLARFVPIVRTFSAFMAGVSQMPYLRFLPFSVCGGIGWVFLMTTLGYLLGQVTVRAAQFRQGHPAHHFDFADAHLHRSVESPPPRIIAAVCPAPFNYLHSALPLAASCLMHWRSGPLLISTPALAPGCSIVTDSRHLRLCWTFRRLSNYPAITPIST
jgi:membrane-associated protein